jgi:hypothetical protein
LKWSTWIVAALVIVCVEAWSNEPAKAPGVPANQQANRPAESEKKPDQKPKAAADKMAPVPSLPSKSQNEHGGNDTDASAYDRSEYWTILGRKLKITDTILAVFTLALVLIGAWQGAHLKRTVSSFIAGERPYIYPIEPTHHGFEPPHKSQARTPRVSISFVNLGKTIAVIRGVRAELFFGDLPKRPIFSYSAMRRGYVIARPDTTAPFNVFYFNREMAPDELTTVLKGTTKAYFFGHVIYTDIFDRMHEKGFCFYIHANSAQCETAGGRPYNYSKSTNTPKHYEG